MLELLLGLGELLLAEIEPNKQAVQRVTDRQKFSFAHIGLNRADKLIVNLFLLLLRRILHVVRELLILLNHVLKDHRFAGQVLTDLLLHLDLDVKLLDLFSERVDAVLLLSGLPLLHRHRHRRLLLFLLLHLAQNCVLFIAKELAFAPLFVIAFTDILTFDVLLYVLAVLLLHTRVGKREIIPQVVFIAVCGAVAAVIRLRVRLGVAAVEGLISDLGLELFIRLRLLHRQCLLILLLLLLLLFVVAAVVRAVVAVIFLVTCGSGFGCVQFYRSVDFRGQIWLPCHTFALAPVRSLPLLLVNSGLVSGGVGF